MSSSSYVDYNIVFQKLKLFQISSNKILTNQDSGMSLLPTAYANEFEAAFCSFCIVKVL